jgi:hypothetical protein
MRQLAPAFRKTRQSFRKDNADNCVGFVPDCTKDFTFDRMAGAKAAQKAA